MSVGHFLGGIAALIHHPVSNKFLILRRSQQKDVGAGHWECVTGRVDQGEGFQEALFREVKEEIGVDLQLEFLLGTTHFFRGQAIPENELIGVVYCGTIANPDAIQVSHEHDEYRWLTSDEIREFFPETHWMIPYINRAEVLLQTTPDSLRSLFTTEGFKF